MAYVPLTTPTHQLRRQQAFSRLERPPVTWTVLVALELRHRIVEFLSGNPERKFKARDIAVWICEAYPNEAMAKLAASASLSSKEDLLNQLVAEIGATRSRFQARHPKIRTIEGTRPRLYYWTSLSDEEEVSAVEADPPESCRADAFTKPREHDLYPILLEYMKNEHGIKGERIDEKRAINSRGAGGNKWLFPDVVGLEDLTHGMDAEIVSAIRESRSRRIRTWSFEVKLLINKSNVRETYYQAVSNSSWSHFGYLVAKDIEGSETTSELRMLYAMHGIGVIRLDTENPSESQIIIPARERTDIEWNMCNRLASENKDFKDVVKRLRQFYQTGDL